MSSSNKQKKISEAINSITEDEGCSKDRLRKLLRDIYYAGPIPKGKKPWRGVEQGEGGPGNNLRRSKDGALWNLTENQEDTLINAAIDNGLVEQKKEFYYTTEKGVSVLKHINTCDECGEVKLPHHREKTVKLSRWNTSTNHSLITKCPECDKGSPSWDRDTFPMTAAKTDDAERITRSIKSAMLYNAGIGEWMEPHLRALNDFITILAEDHYDFDAFKTRMRTPNSLPDADKAFRSIFDDYEVDVIEDFADALLDTYYGACLSDMEQAIVKYIAAGRPTVDRNKRMAGTHHAEYGNPIAVAPNEEWEATIRTHIDNEYITVSGKADKAKNKIRERTASEAFQLKFKSYQKGGVGFYPHPTRDLMRLGTVVEFTVTNERSIDSQTRVEEAIELVSREEKSGTGINNDIASDFRKLANQEDIEKGGSITTRRVNPNLRPEELVRVARVVKRTHDDSQVPHIVTRYAQKELD